MCGGLGAQGNLMAQLEDAINMLHPNIYTHKSKSNCAKNTYGALIGENSMGSRLANEVRKLMHWHKLSGRKVSKLSFIGHSLGGLIIRAALPQLAEYSHLMHSYWSLGSPHLGAGGKNSNWKTAVGSSFTRIFCESSKIMSIMQCKDAKKWKDKCLYKLAKKEGFNWFKNFVFFSSPQDGFVPICSARIQLDQNKDIGTRNSQVA